MSPFFLVASFTFFLCSFVIANAVWSEELDTLALSRAQRLVLKIIVPNVIFWAAWLMFADLAGLL